MQAVDQNVLQFFAENRTEWLSFLMLVVTYAGGYMVASVVTALSAISFLIHKHTSKILPLFISVGGSTATVFIIKNIFDKARPLAEALYLEPTSSFPSGHAAVAIALYGFILFTIWQYDRHHLRNPFIFCLALLILLIGISRLYLGVHYLSDVLVGYIIGLAWLLISLAISKSKTGLLPDGKRL